jgi:hypothetical protein
MVGVKEILVSQYSTLEHILQIIAHSLRFLSFNAVYLCIVSYATYSFDICEEYGKRLCLPSPFP